MVGLKLRRGPVFCQVVIFWNRVRHSFISQLDIQRGKKSTEGKPWRSRWNSIHPRLGLPGSLYNTIGSGKTCLLMFPHRC